MEPAIRETPRRDHARHAGTHHHHLMHTWRRYPLVRLPP
jgi:hypothetical protein